MDYHLADELNPDMPVSSKSKKMKKTSKVAEEVDELSDDSTNAESSGTEAE
jgi:hypothetical protein